MVKKGGSVKRKEKKVTLKELQELALKKRDCLIMRNYRRLSTRITFHLVKTSLLPWHVTLLSIAFGFISAGFFLLGEYSYILAGALFIQLSYLFDCVDGEIARAKKNGSNWGRWLDQNGDFATAFAVYGAAAAGLFFQTQDANVLLVGIAALFNISMVMFTTATKKGLFDPKKTNPSVKLSKKYYIGGQSLLVTAITLGAIFNQMLLVLWFFATFGLLAWLKVVYGTWKQES